MTSSESTPIVKLDSVTVSMNGKTVLDDINLVIGPGVHTGIIGPNGGGKTTLLKVILGLIPPDRGTVQLFGHLNPGETSPKGMVGYVPQKCVVDPRFPVSVFDVVMMGRYGPLGLFRRPGKKDRDVAMENLQKVEMEKFADRPIGHLSGGEQQKVFIARALCSSPQLLILDEPTTGVDVQSQDQFYRLINQLKIELGLTVIMVSHDVGMITSYIDDLVCINQRVFIHGKSPDVLSEKILQETYGCEVEMIFHGHFPHRVIDQHNPEETE